ncbi:MAG: DUF6165 family protein [Alphaproteobacteria bacterium]|nr:DUF6165 family protein [Alphaproteobacteria bacterium]
MPTSTPNSDNSIVIEVSPGELIDRLTILEIKSNRISDPEKLRNVRHELSLYRTIRSSQLPVDGKLSDLQGNLRAINETLWDIEDEIRACEAQQDFGARFIDLARAVYRENDRRATIKREINMLLGSTIIEEKSYTPY